MALKIARGKTLPIGVDLGTSTVKLAQLRMDNGELDLVAAASAQIPPTHREAGSRRNGFLAQAIRKILRSARFKGKQCILSLPAEDTIVQHLKIANVSGGAIDQLIHQELQGRLPYPVEDAIIRHIVAGESYGESDSKQEVIAVCTARQVLTSYLTMARRAKLDVIGVNIESCAIVECFSRLFRRDNDVARTILYMDMGATTTQVVFAHGRKMVFSRNLTIGGDQFDQAVGEAMNVPAEQGRAIRTGAIQGQEEHVSQEDLYRLLSPTIDSLADEVTKCLRYYESVFHDQGVERAIFVGGGAYDKRLCQTLAQRLNLPAQIGDPLVRIRRAPDPSGTGGLDPRQPHPDWAVAIGLSLGQEAAA